MDDLEDILSQQTLESFERNYNRDVAMTPILVPPIPIDNVIDTIGDPWNDGDIDEETSMLVSHFYAMADIAKAAWHVGDPITADMMYIDDPTKETYAVSPLTVTELKLAQSILYSSYDREMNALAERLGIDTMEYYGATELIDLEEAILDEVGYEHTEPEYADQVVEIAELIDEEPERVYDALHDEFGEDTEFLKIDNDGNSEMFDITDALEEMDFEE